MAFIFAIFYEKLAAISKKMDRNEKKNLFGSKKIGAGGDENIEIYLLYGLMDFFTYLYMSY